MSLPEEASWLVLAEGGKQARLRLVTRSRKGMSSPEEQVGATPVAHARGEALSSPKKGSRLALAQGNRLAGLQQVMRMEKACTRPRMQVGISSPEEAGRLVLTRGNKQPGPQQVTRSGKGMFSPEDQAGTNPAGHAKQQRLVLARGISKRDLGRSREAA